MKPVEFEGQNLMLMPPRGAEPGTCGQLPTYRAADGSRIVSVWKPGPEDLKALADGAHVLLHVHSASHPPVWMSVQKMKELP